MDSNNNFYNGWNSSLSEKHPKNRHNQNHTKDNLREEIESIERSILYLEEDVSLIKREISLCLDNGDKTLEYLKELQRINTYSRELQLVQIKNVVLSLLPNLINQVVPELVRVSVLNREDIVYEEEEEGPSASHIQDISNKTTILCCQESSLCSICHHNIEDNEIIRKINHCGHFFHIKCLETWLGEHNSCPLCRYQI